MITHSSLDSKLCNLHVFAGLFKNTFNWKIFLNSVFADTLLANINIYLAFGAST